jgi:hypothetical protein
MSVTVSCLTLPDLLSIQPATERCFPPAIDHYRTRSSMPPRLSATGAFGGYHPSLASIQGGITPGVRVGRSLFDHPASVQPAEGSSPMGSVVDPLVSPPADRMLRSVPQSKGSGRIRSLAISIRITATQYTLRALTMSLPEFRSSPWFCCQKRVFVDWFTA